MINCTGIKERHMKQKTKHDHRALPYVLSDPLNSTQKYMYTVYGIFGINFEW